MTEKPTSKNVPDNWRLYLQYEGCNLYIVYPPIDKDNKAKLESFLNEIKNNPLTKSSVLDT